MNAIFFISVILKGVGAILEVLLQILITRRLGVDGYGTYSTWINAADLIFWILFSALTKCNTYYLSTFQSSMTRFKKKYYGCYVLPVLLIGAAACGLTGKGEYWILLVITGLELRVMDQSSSLLAQNHQMISLTGEYVLGRLLLVIGFFVLNGSGMLTPHSLVELYLFQYLVIMLVFAVFRKFCITETKDISDTVSLKKWGSYQRADLIQSMIGQMPVLLQYFFSGAFEAGVVSVVLTVKKLINFISGPTAKVFLPEFSRLYKNGKREEIGACYASIMRIQMLFAGPLSVVLIAYPDVILRILDKKLLDYVTLFISCSMVFIFAATLGPCSGVLQMTGNESKDNLLREIALGVMFVVMWIFRKDSLFVLYGLCAQALLEEIGKYYYVCRWLEKSPVKVKTYLSWWICPGAVIVLTYILKKGDSLVWMLIAAGVVFLIGAVSEVRKEGGISSMMKRGERE